MRKLNDKVISEVFGYSAIILRCISHHHIQLRKHYNLWIVVESINDYAGTISFRISETHHTCTLCWCYFGPDIIVGKIHFIIIGLHIFGHMREPWGSFIFIKDRFSGLRHKRKHAIIVYPGAGLMGLLQSSDFMCSVNILPTIAISTCLRRPKVHSPRQSNSRIGVTCREFKGWFRTHQGVNKRCIIACFVSRLNASSI